MKKTGFKIFASLAPLLLAGEVLAHPALLPHPHPHGIEDQNSLMVISGLVVLSCCALIYARARKVKGVKK